MNGKLILFPVPIGADDIDISLPRHNLELLNSCHSFFVEELRSARRFLKHAGYLHSVDDNIFFVLNEHTLETADNTAAIQQHLAPIFDGENVGLLSEAGLPCIADPGRLVTRQAQRHGIEIVPLVGPSSLMLALMASGLNGQNFAFAGYLPVERAERAKAIRTLEQKALREHQTQIFIEAPYRNNQMLDTLATTLGGDTLICVATDLTMPTQSIVTLTAAQWRQRCKETNLHKRNTVFLVGC